jgi:hypothetical protein
MLKLHNQYLSALQNLPNENLKRSLPIMNPITDLEMKCSDNFSTNCSSLDSVSVLNISKLSKSPSFSKPLLFESSFPILSYACPVSYSQSYDKYFCADESKSSFFKNSLVISSATDQIFDFYYFSLEKMNSSSCFTPSRISFAYSSFNNKNSIKDIASPQFSSKCSKLTFNYLIDLSAAPFSFPSPVFSAEVSIPKMCFDGLSFPFLPKILQCLLNSECTLSSKFIINLFLLILSTKFNVIHNYNLFFEPLSNSLESGYYNQQNYSFSTSFENIFSPTMITKEEVTEKNNFQEIFSNFDWNMVDENYCTALHYASLIKIDDEEVDILSFLLFLSSPSTYSKPNLPSPFEFEVCEQKVYAEVAPFTLCLFHPTLFEIFCSSSNSSSPCIHKSSLINQSNSAGSFESKKDNDKLCSYEFHNDYNEFLFLMDLEDAHLNVYLPDPFSTSLIHSPLLNSSLLSSIDYYAQSLSFLKKNIEDNTKGCSDRKKHIVFQNHDYLNDSELITLSNNFQTKSIINDNVIIKLILPQKPLAPNVNCLNKEGASPLSISLSHFNTSSFLLILQHPELDPNAGLINDNYAVTPLHVIVENWSRDDDSSEYEENSYILSDKNSIKTCAESRLINKNQKNILMLKTLLTSVGNKVF